MKKFLLLGVIATMGLGVFTSCGDDECNCTSSFGVSRTIDPASFNADNCSDLEIILEKEAEEGSYSCN